MTMDDREDFTSGPILSKMAFFMTPILFALILQAMYGAVDLLIVGRFGTTAGISAVATGSSILAMITFIVAQLAAGVSVLLGRYIGERRRDRIGRLIGGAVAFFLLLSILLSLLLFAFARPFSIIMQAPAEAVDLTVSYIRICACGLVFVIFYNLISSVFRGLGNSRLPLLFVAIACIVNIAGDLLFVAVFRMDVGGAALATILAQAVSVILSILIAGRRKLGFSFSLQDIGFNSEVGLFLHIGLPLAFQEFLTNLTFLALCAFVNRLGLDASSGYGVSQKLQSFVMLLPSAIMQTMASFVAQNVGAEKERRALKGMVYGMAMGVAAGVLISLAVFFKADLMASLFTRDDATIRRAFECMRGFAPEAIVTSILFSYMGYFNGHSKSLFVMVQGMIQSFAIRLPMAYIMSALPNASLTGIALAGPAATVVGILLCTLYFLRLKRKLVFTD